MADFNLSMMLKNVNVNPWPVHKTRNFDPIQINGEIMPVTIRYNKFTGEYMMLNVRDEEIDPRELLDRGMVRLGAAKTSFTMDKISDFGRGEVEQYTGIPMRRKPKIPMEGDV